jgi:DNA-binding Xre family transcriptional regulator
MAMARAHDIPVPTPHTLGNMPAIQRAVWFHPKFTTEPLLRLLLIPQNENEPLRQVELVRDSTVDKKICKILGCQMSDFVVLHSEDMIAYVRGFYSSFTLHNHNYHALQAKGKPDGVGIGRMHTSYEAFMDDFAVSRRPLNRRASTLLRRPDTHGPILVMKTTLIKAKDSKALGRTEDILCWDKLTEAELKGEAFKKLREEWIAVKGTGDLPRVIEIRKPM